MERLKNFTGGRGYYVDDSEKLQVQVSLLQDYIFRMPDTQGSGTIENFLQQIQNFVVGGCEVVGGVIQPGVVQIGSRMIHVAEPITPSSFPCFMRDQGDLETGFRNYDIDQQTKAAFSKGYVTVSTTVPSGDFIKFESTGPERRLFEFIRQLMRFAPTEWNDLTLLNGWTGNLKWYFSREGFIYVRGSINGTSATDETIASMPNAMSNGASFTAEIAIANNIDAFLNIVDPEINIGSYTPANGYSQAFNIPPTIIGFNENI